MKLITVFILTFLFQFANAQIKNAPTVKQIPSISVYNVRGESFNLSELTAGKITVIDFWFLPCAPCFFEMSMLHELYSKYKDNPHFQFLTITRTDTSLVRPLINNDTIGDEISRYYKKYSGLETFQLPVYFIPGCNEKLHTFGKSKVDFKGSNIPPDNSNKCPDVVFKFVGFPTLLIFDKRGKLIYYKNGFQQNIEKKQQQEIEKLITTNLSRF